jgi:hypothetical protein
MDASSPPSGAERELDELRRGAYGRHPDIRVDPAALARLTELEAARTTGPPDGADTEIDKPAAAAVGAPVGDSTRTASGAGAPDPAAGNAPVVASSEGSPLSLWRRLTATRAGRFSIVVGVLVAGVALADTVAGLVGPRPDATLRLAAYEADRGVLRSLTFLGADVDPSSIRGYQPYRGVEPWFSVDRQGLQCLMLIDRSAGSVDGANCVPPGVDLFADIGAWPLVGSDFIDDLPDGSIIRFHYRGDSVDVFRYPASEAD